MKNSYRSRSARFLLVLAIGIALFSGALAGFRANAAEVGDSFLQYFDCVRSDNDTHSPMPVAFDLYIPMNEKSNQWIVVEKYGQKHQRTKIGRITQLLEIPGEKGDRTSELSPIVINEKSSHKLVFSSSAMQESKRTGKSFEAELQRLQAPGALAKYSCSAGG